VLANTLAPEIVALGMAIANRLLPAPGDASGNELHSGWQSASRWAPSRLTRLTGRAAAANNELPASPLHVPAANIHS
jgi:hypothetical protein